MGSGGLHGLQNRWSASLAMSTDGSFPSRPRQFSNLTLTSRPMLSTASSSSFCLRPRMKTKAPSSTNSLAVASPIPEVPVIHCDFVLQLPVDDLPRLAHSCLAAKRPVRPESVSCDRSRQAESCHYAALKCRDCADPIAS